MPLVVYCYEGLSCEILLTPNLVRKLAVSLGQ
jgi:hypothetical protein